jgi:hypothetical protein
MNDMHDKSEILSDFLKKTTRHWTDAPNPNKLKIKENPCARDGKSGIPQGQEPCTRNGIGVQILFGDAEVQEMHFRDTETYGFR